MASRPNRYLLSGSFAVLLVVALILIRGFGFDILHTNAIKERDNDMLTNHESFIIRRIIYQEGLSTCLSTEGPWATHETLVVPKEIAEIHKKNRVGTLKLLLEIVKGGRQQDALAAAGFAIALEEDPIAALGCMHYPPGLFDQEVANDERSRRQLMVDGISELLSQAERH